MADLILFENIPVEKMQRIVAAVVDLQGPIPMTPAVPPVLDAQGNVTTPGQPAKPAMTPVEFAKRKIKDYVIQLVRESERRVAERAVADAAVAKATQDFEGL